MEVILIDEITDYNGVRLIKASGLLEAVVTNHKRVYDTVKAGGRLGPVTGLSRVDKTIGGALMPGLHTIHGSPGAGKTAFCVQVACNCGCPAVVITCEQCPQRLIHRVIANKAGKPLGSMSSDDYEPGEFAEFAQEALEQVPGLYFVDASRQSIPVFATEGEPSVVTFAQMVKGDNDHVLVVIDSIHSYVDGLYNQDSEYDAIRAVMCDLVRLAMELKCPVLCVAERNRQSQESGGMSASAGSRKLEYRPETVFELNRNRDDVCRGDEFDVMLRISKNRHGPAGKDIPLLFHGPFQRFEERK